MPLFEINQESGLVPFRLLRGGADLYEEEIEELLWSDLEAFTGESLFPIRRQAQIQGGGRPDIVALDRGANVVVVEVKRDVDRGQLAQCLEYAGWARSTSLDELAGLYHRGADSFFSDWSEFTESDAPVVLSRSPRLVLVAREFHDRTESAFRFLVENGLPVTVITVALYQDDQGRRFVAVEGEHEPESAGPTSRPDREEYWKVGGRRILVTDLLDHGLLEAGERLVWDRPRLDEHYEAWIEENGTIRLPDGRLCPSPSRAAVEAAGIVAYGGWGAWVVERLGVPLSEVRDRYRSSQLSGA